MKYLFLILLIGMNANAANWMSKTDISEANQALDTTKTSYVSQQLCESSELEDCFKIDGKDPRTHAVKFVNGKDQLVPDSALQAKLDQKNQAQEQKKQDKENAKQLLKNYNGNDPTIKAIIKLLGE